MCGEAARFRDASFSHDRAGGPHDAAAPHGRAVEFRDVSFSYGQAPLIAGLDATFECGCVTGIVGPNGCGKSTLLKLAGGLLEPRSGELLVSGKSLRDLRPSDRARLVALLPQDTPRVAMPVRDLALSGRYSHLGLLQLPAAADREAAEEALGLVGASSFADRPVNSLSGGQRQRAYLALLLAQNAPVMLLDEPTSALDIRAAHDILALVRDVRVRREATVIIVMHDLDLALRYCDRLAVMSEGKMLAHDSAQAIAASSVLQRVFHIDLFHHETPHGPSYTFAPGTPKEDALSPDPPSPPAGR